MTEPQKRLLLPQLDVGQSWFRWTPQVAKDDPWLAQAVREFQPVATPAAYEAGQAAARWLRERSLLDYRSSVTKLMVIDGTLEGFYSLAASRVELRTSHRRNIGEYPVQPAALVTWLAKRSGALITGKQILLHALGTALKVAEDIGVVAIVLDPYDDRAAELWRAEPYQFRTSLTRAPDGSPRLWRTLLR